MFVQAIPTRLMRPAVRARSRIVSCGPLITSIADIVAVMSAINPATGEPQDYVLLQHYKPALVGAAPDILCHPQDRDDEEELLPIRHPLVPACEYIVLSNDFTLQPPSCIIGRAVLVPCIPSARSPMPAMGDAMFKVTHHEERYYCARSTFFALRPIL